jgi:SnoaL-like protein
MHFLGSSSVELDGDRAFVETYCVVHQRVQDATGDGDGDGPRRVTVGCRYLDRFEHRSGTWRIARRVVAYEWWAEQPCEGERELGPEWTVSRRSGDDALYQMQCGEGR